MNLITERLIIRPIELSDKVDVFEYRSDSETNKYQGWVPKKIEDVAEFIGKTSNEINVPDTWFQYVILKKDTNKIIGDIGVYFQDEEGYQAEIGCTLNKHFHHKGYATEALKGVVDFLFIEQKKHRIVASIDPANNSSIRLVERLGFRKEAHFVKSLLIDGAWVDDMIYAILEEEWGN